jgi:hypothetical protein
MTTHASLPSLSADQFVNATTNRHNSWGSGTTRMGEQQQLGASRNDGEDWTTSTPTQRQKWGPFGGDVRRSKTREGKRKASELYDATEKTRKIQKCSDQDYLEVSQVEQFAATSSTTSDARYVGFGSPQVIQSEAEDHGYLVPVHSLRRFMSDGLTGSPALTSPRENYGQLDQSANGEDQHSLHESFSPREENFEVYPRERFADSMFDIPRIPWQLKPKLDQLDHDLVFQHFYSENPALHQDQHNLAENFTPHIEYPSERLAERSSV